MSGSDRFGAFTKSPLTGIWLECYCGGSFARALTETGWDAVVVRGAADRAGAPPHHCRQPAPRLLPADDLWGKDTCTVEDRAAGRSGQALGRALHRSGRREPGPVASVMHEEAHALGRGGMGAVFGSKKLKAVTRDLPRAAQAGGSGAVRPAPPGGRPSSQRNRPLAANYHRFGTPVMVGPRQRGRRFPHRLLHQGDGSPPGHARGRALDASGPSTRATAVPPVPLRCRHSADAHRRARRPGARYTLPEYETLYSFGGSCMVEHARDVAKLNERCNLLGMDSISAGNLAAVAIKARQLGKLPEGPAPGDVEGIDRLLDRDRHTVPPPPATRWPKGMDNALDRLGHERVVDHQQGHGPGRLRTPAAQGHGSQLRRQRARRLPPARHLLQAGAGRAARGPGRRPVRGDLHRLGRPHAPHGQPHHVPLLPRSAALGADRAHRRSS